MEEEENRFQVFKENVEYYESENTKGHNFTLGINLFADLTQDEFVGQHCSGVVLPKDGVPTPDFVHTMSGLQAPQAIDWEQRGAVTQVKDQGRCGSCWSFSTTGALESAYKIKKGQLLSLSEEELINCEVNDIDDGCHGGFPSDGFNWVKSNGLCSETDYPYDHTDHQTCRQRNCNAVLQPGVVTGYVQVPASESAMMDAVAQQPVSVLLWAGQWGGYTGGIFSAEQCRPWQGYHAVLIVGYSPEYWRVKNSWGAEMFGESGYIRLERGTGGTGACDILHVATYPQIAGGPSPPSPTPSPWNPTPTPSPWTPTPSPWNPTPTPSPWNPTPTPSPWNPTPSPWNPTPTPNPDCAYPCQIGSSGQCPAGGSCIDYAGGCCAWGEVTV